MSKLSILLKYRKVATLIVTIGLGVGVILLAMSAPHWWKKCKTAKISSDGPISPQSDVYCYADGSVMVNLEGDGVYIIHRQDFTIGTSNRPSYFMLFNYAYSREVPPPFTIMNSVKSVEPNLKIEKNNIEFNSMSSGRIRITFE